MHEESDSDEDVGPANPMGGGFGWGNFVPGGQYQGNYISIRSFYISVCTQLPMHVLYVSRWREFHGRWTCFSRRSAQS